MRHPDQCVGSVVDLAYHSLFTVNTRLIIPSVALLWLCSIDCIYHTDTIVFTSRMYLVLPLSLAHDSRLDTFVVEYPSAR